MGRRPPGQIIGDAVVARLAGAAFSALRSTIWSLLRGEDVLDGDRAVSAVVLQDERRTPVLLAAAAPVYAGISVGWTAVMSAALPDLSSLGTHGAERWKEDDALVNLRDGIASGCAGAPTKAGG